MGLLRNLRRQPLLYIYLLLAGGFLLIFSQPCKRLGKRLANRSCQRAWLALKEVTANACSSPATLSLKRHAPVSHQLNNTAKNSLYGKGGEANTLRNNSSGVHASVFHTPLPSGGTRLSKEIWTLFLYFQKKPARNKHARSHASEAVRDAHVTTFWKAHGRIQRER